MKKVILLLTMTLFIFVIGCSPKAYVPFSIPSSEPVTQEPNLELIGGISGAHDEIIDYGHYIIGSIKNNTSYKYSYAQVTFILLDKDNNQVGTAMDNINDLEPGATWKFKALIFDDSEVKYYKLGDISGR